MHGGSKFGVGGVRRFDHFPWKLFKSKHHRLPHSLSSATFTQCFSSSSAMASGRISFLKDLYFLFFSLKFLLQILPCKGYFTVCLIQFPLNFPIFSWSFDPILPLNFLFGFPEILPEPKQQCFRLPDPTYQRLFKAWLEKRSLKAPRRGIQIATESKHLKQVRAIKVYIIRKNNSENFV